MRSIEHPFANAKRGGPFASRSRSKRAKRSRNLLQRGGGSSPYLFPGCGPGGHLSTRQYARLLAEWLAMIGLDPCLYGTHSLRRTKATLIYKKTGNLRAVQLLLGHTKIESTVRYLGIEVDDALAIAERIDVSKPRQSRHALPPNPRPLCAISGRSR